ncbi:50S ribosomal protein L11 [Methanonatronarchaeum sp. AMET-Sl]|uniref:50S ribosomal protein L11 n=1 Tax=Methanonatronarchaeum sp. AMET-Sl TaxID=3037654 RepID=UPI00244E1322|nr:50S ribosomal protein L11 [Methanonatronarchaeum sp. AMET-Sl]WGI16687.1 50S ribosomal protein L11 [Methanonatronarchaeum sp. AMET-Sl]
MEEINALVDAGNVSPGPPLGPKLGPLGVNIQKVVDDINKETRDFEGMQIPVTLKVDPDTKEYEIEVGKPPTTALVKKEAGVEKASGNPGSEYSANISRDQIEKIAEMKKEDLLGKDTEQRMKEVAGTCRSMGIKVDGKEPQEFIDSL